MLKRLFSGKKGGKSTSTETLGSFSAKSIDGEDVALSKYLGKKNYTELVQVHQKYADKGFEVLAFPCNQFGGQEPGTNAEIKAFAGKYGVKFPMFDKIDVNGDDAHPLYKWMKKEKPDMLIGESIKWNFAKFLLDKEGKVVDRFIPTTNPLSIAGDIEKLL